MVCLGLPLALILAWAFELTPDGIRSTKSTRDRAEGIEDESHHRKRNWFAYGVGAILPTLIFGALALYFYFQVRGVEVAADKAAIEAEAVADKSIAVLPLENLSPNQENAFFASGIQEDILTNLSKIMDLRVLSRSSTMRYTDPDRDLKLVGKELGVRYLVEGSVRRVGEEVRVTVQLIDAVTDEHLWAENYDRTLKDVFAIQSAIAREIAEQLKATVSPKEIALIEARPTENPEAYDYFLKFRQLQADAGATMGDEKIALLEKALELDPEYAMAWSQLAVECVWWWDVGKGRNDIDMLTKGYRALDVAERLDPDSPNLRWAKATFAIYLTQDMDAYIYHLEQALIIDPSFNVAHSRLARLHFKRGNFEKSEDHLRRAFGRDPAAVNRRLAEARREGDAELIFAYWNLLNAMLYQGKWDEARELASRIEGQSELFGRLTQWSLLDIEYYQHGDWDRYLNGLLKLNEENPPLLEVVLLTGDWVRAIEMIKDLGYDSNVGYYSGLILMDPVSLSAAWSWFQLGDMANARRVAIEAREFMEERVSASPDTMDRYRIGLAYVSAFLGDAKGVEELMEEERRLLGSYHMMHIEFEVQYAKLCLVMGDHEAAIDHLERAVGFDVSWNVVRFTGIESSFQQLKGHPRYDALIMASSRPVAVK
jgi:TolB-like protein